MPEPDARESAPETREPGSEAREPGPHTRESRPDTRESGSRVPRVAGSGPPVAGLHDHLPGDLLPAPVLRPGRVAALAAALGLLAAAALWAAFTGVGPAWLDAAALDESIEIRSGGLTQLAIAVTTLGSTVAMAVLAVLVGAGCWWRGRRADAVLAVGAMAGASLVFRALKVAFDRARPPVADRLVTETNESLPSGHATMSIVVIGTLVVLAWAGRRVAVRVAMVAAAVLWVGAVGATRVYLGVHWISDVLAGWLTGAAWLALCVAAWSRRRRRTLRPMDTPG